MSVVETRSQLSSLIRKPDTKPTGLPLSVGEALPLAVQRIVDTLHPEKIILFGSYAHGNPTPDSDVDLLVVMETTEDPTQRYIKVSSLLYPRMFPVDIWVKTPKEMEAAMQKSDILIKEIIQTGQVIYERPE